MASKRFPDVTPRGGGDVSDDDGGRAPAGYADSSGEEVLDMNGSHGGCIDDQAPEPKVGLFHPAVRLAIFLTACAAGWVVAILLIAGVLRI